MPFVDDHVIRKERDEEGTTVRQALADASALCQRAEEAAPLFHQVLTRLEFVRDAFEHNYSSLEDDVKQRSLRAFENEVVKFAAEVQFYCEASFTERVLRHKKLARTMKAIHEGAPNVYHYYEGGLDQLFRTVTKVPHDQDVVNEWKEPHDKAVDAMEAVIKEKVDDDATLEMYKKDPLLALEAATLLCQAERSRSPLEWISNDAAQTLQDKIKSIADSDDIILPDWFIPNSDINYKGRQFGQGSYGSVHYGTWRSGAKVVVKVLLTGNTTDQRLSQTLRKKFIEEATLWSKMWHPYVLRMYGACHVTSPPYFVCEDCVDKGDLSALLQRDKSRIWRLLFETGLAIEYLHGKNIVHGDLKLNNILIGGDGYARVADFGLSRLRKSSKKDLTKQESVVESSGALRWRAPEALLTKPGPASDVYSFGMCLIEAFSGNIPYVDLDDEMVKDKIERNELPDRPLSMSDDIWSLVKRMTAKEPEDRATIKQVIQVLKPLAKEELNKEMETTCVCQICNNPVDGAKYCHKCMKAVITKPMPKEVGKILSKDDLPRVIELVTLSNGQHEHKAPNALRDYMFGQPDHQKYVFEAGAIPILSKVLADEDDSNDRMESLTAVGCTMVANKKFQDHAKFEGLIDSLHRELFDGPNRIKTKAMLVLGYMAHGNPEIRLEIASDTKVMAKIRELSLVIDDEDLPLAAKRAIMFLDQQEP